MGGRGRCTPREAVQARFLMDSSRDDVLIYMSFPREHWTQIA